MVSKNDNKTLDLYPIDYPFETLFNRITQDKPKLILDPDFQRKYKWDKEGWERASKFIESCLMRIPLPSCYFAEIEGGKHIVIDGVQRLTTIVKYFNDEFSLEGLSVFKELEGKLFSEIGDYQSELEATTIRCIILRKENPKKIIREIFSRLNQGAVRLSDQEIRHAIYPGIFDGLLRELAQTPSIKNFGRGIESKIEKDSLEAEEQVLRFFALQGDLESYEGTLSKFLDDFMEKKIDIKTDEIDVLRKLFQQSLSNCEVVFGGDVFKDTTKQRKKQSMVYYDLLMQSLGILDERIILEKKELIKTAFEKLCASTEFQKSLSGGLQKKSSILKRRQIWNELLGKALND